MTIPFREFVALGAVLIALTALSIDIMLPALPQIAAEFSLETANDRQLVIFSYLVGLAPGQVTFGPLSDRYGRRPIMLIGLGIYAGASALALFSSSFEMLLLARALQGFGAAAPRTVLIASVRDLYLGAHMARVMSLIMAVFLFVPIMAPALGQLLILAFDWTAPFVFLFCFGLVAVVWAAIRFPETRDEGEPGQAPLRLGAAFAGMFTARQSLTYLIASGFVLGCLMSYIASSQQIFVDIYGLGPWFPAAFAGTAFAMVTANLLNSRIVMRVGTRCVSHTALAGLFGVGVLFLAGQGLFGAPNFAITIGFFVVALFLFGLTVQNFNALAMEPQGRSAGMASAVFGTYTTLAGALFGWLVGGAFDGSVAPISVGLSALALAALVVIYVGEGRLHICSPDRRG